MTFPESDWAMFSAKGPLPDSLQALNTRVWEEWYPKEGKKYRAGGGAMLEVYSPGDMQSPDYECGIWVPVFNPEKENESEAAEIISTMMITGIL
ncbi:MAG: GyrI-like domain-containing protein [Clostridia bacterium]|nr:GyrI-like domain-containing protein [Clostridia bacterium]